MSGVKRRVAAGTVNAVSSRAAAAGTTDLRPAPARLVTAALQVVEAHGLEALTTRAVAAQVGLTQPAIYRHFRSKTDLADLVVRAIGRLFAEAVREATAARGTADALTAALRVYRTFALERPRFFDALFMRHPRRAGIPTGPDEVFTRLVGLVRDCMAAGVLAADDPVDVALSLAAYARGLVLMYRRRRFASEKAFSQFYDRSLDRLFTGIARRTARRATRPRRSVS